jgi:uncharacterized protein (TIGR02145 family)
MKWYISYLLKSSIHQYKTLILSIIILLVIGIFGVMAQTVTDIDGNIYNTVKIGTQVWMQENLKTTKYSDGTAIPNVTDSAGWSQLTTPGFCWNKNDEVTYKAAYGALYNWYVVDAASNGGKKVCPAGWIVPTDEYWTVLITYLGGENVAGGKLKEAGTVHWQSPNEGATNESGFTALPGGNRNGNGNFFITGYNGYWWSSTAAYSYFAYLQSLYYNHGIIYRRQFVMNSGFSIRCIEDISTDVPGVHTSLIRIYPNPVSGILTVDFNSEDYETVIIRNLQGIILKKEKAFTPSQQFDLSYFKPGFYILEFVKTSGETERVKIIKL